jgi:hypothetical protein
MYSEGLFKAYVLRRGYITQNYDVFNTQVSEIDQKLAQINEVTSPYS